MYSGLYFCVPLFYFTSFNTDIYILSRPSKDVVSCTFYDTAVHLIKVTETINSHPLADGTVSV